MTDSPNPDRVPDPPLALQDLKILDLSRLAPGPYCSMLLADMGADVLVIDPDHRTQRRNRSRG